MGQSNGGVCCIDALSSVSGSTHHIDADILFIDLHIHFFRFGHDRYGDGRCVNPSAGLCFRHTLYAMHTAFVFQNGIGALARYHKGDALHAADTDFFHFGGLHLPTSALGIMYIHPIDFRGKERRFIAARARAYFDDNVLIIIRVFGKKQYFQLLLQFFHSFFRRRQLFFQHFPHFFIGLAIQHGKAVLNILTAFPIFLISLHNRRQIALFLHQ